MGIPEDPAEVLDVHPATAEVTPPPVIQPLPVQVAATGGGGGEGWLVMSPLAKEETSAVKKQISEYSSRPQDAILYQLLWW